MIVRISTPSSLRMVPAEWRPSCTRRSSIPASFSSSLNSSQSSRGSIGRPSARQNTRSLSCQALAVDASGGGAPAPGWPQSSRAGTAQLWPIEGAAVPPAVVPGRAEQPCPLVSRSVVQWRAPSGYQGASPLHRGVGRRQTGRQQGGPDHRESEGVRDSPAGVDSKTVILAQPRSKQHRKTPKCYM